MKKSSSLLASVLMPVLAAALAAPSCAGGETSPGGTGSGSASGSGGTSSGSGGRSGNGSGGATTFGSGGAPTSGSGGGSFNSGGATGSGTGGGSTFGSGGASTSGSGGAGTGTGTGGAPVAGGPLSVVDGYAMGGAWMGYAYTFVGPMTGSKATITPLTFMAMTSLCVSGMILPDPAYASVAGMGWNISQAKATTAAMPAINTVATAGTGLTVNVGSVMGLTLATGGGSQLRAQIKTATADYCAPIPAAGVSTIPWAMFNTKCWNTAEVGAAAFTAGTAIKAVELVVPSGTAMIGPFGFCLADAH